MAWVDCIRCRRRDYCRTCSRHAKQVLGTWCLSGFSDGDVYKRDHPNLHPAEPPCGDEQAAFIEITRDALHPRGKGNCPLAENKVVGRNKSAVVYRLTFPRCGIGWTAYIADVLTVKLFDED